MVQFIVVAATFGLSVWLTRLIIALNISDVPNERSSHTKPTPKSGGLSIAPAFLAGLFVLYLLSDVTEPNAITFAIYFVLMGLLVPIGLADDLLTLSPGAKLGAQCAFSLLFVVFVGHVDTIWLPGMGTIDLGLLGYLGSILWIVFFMNAFNFMDGINGLASGGALIASICLAIISLYSGVTVVFIASIALAAATLGFFVFNFPSGQIFLGDTGSQFLAFVLATLAIVGSPDSFGTISVYVVPLLFFPFIFDVLLTLAYRARHKQDLSRAHRWHLYQILTEIGFSHVQVSGIYFVYFVVSAIGAALVQAADPMGRIGVILGLTLVFGFHAAFVYVRGARLGKLPHQIAPA